MSAGLIDSHCHLDAAYFPGGPDEALARAAAVGVSGFVVVGVGETLAPARAAIALATARPKDIAAAVGVHPHDAKHFSEMEEELGRLAKSDVVVAVGECGLDYHYDHSPRDVQRDAFAKQIALARAVKKPIVVHTRSAPADTLDVLESEGAKDVGGVIHCFSEDRAFATRALAMGFYVSFSGIVTFKNAKDVQDVAGWAPADRILVETDSPYLAPVPHRGKPCEPAYVVRTAEQVAKLRGIAFEELAQVSTQNATALFRRNFG
jgi:TatD DNase family protein